MTFFHGLMSLYFLYLVNTLFFFVLSLFDIEPIAMAVSIKRNELENMELR